MSREPKSQRRVLVAEDDPSVLKMTKLRLEHEGYRVIVASDGQEALDRATGDDLKIDLILLDVRMPKLDGFQVCQRLKEQPSTRDIPIVVFTASESNMRHLANRCLELGISGWLKKPFRSSDLMDHVHRALEA